MRKAGFVFGAMVVAVLALGSSAAEEKVPTIKKIMQTATGEKGLCAKTVEAGKAGKWADAQKYGKSLTDCCANLPKNKVPKGDEKKWEMLTKQFAEQGSDIAKAADDKDVEALTKSAESFVKACGTCHMEFKPKKGK